MMSILDECGLQMNETKNIVDGFYLSASSGVVLYPKSAEEDKKVGGSMIHGPIEVMVGLVVG
jgi:hypothetical protein